MSERFHTTYFTPDVLSAQMRRVCVGSGLETVVS